MSLQSAIETALSGVASGRVATDAARQDWTVPFVVFEVTDDEVIETLDASFKLTRATGVFLCQAATKQAALTLRGQVESAIEGASSLIAYSPFPVAPSGEKNYEPETDQFLEITAYSFWR